MSLLGQSAPDFTLPASTGQDVRLSDFKGKQNVVLVFYPLDFSPVCSMQLPEYSGRQDDFAELDTVVLGVNRDSVYTHRAWAAEYGIDVPLLADLTLSVARAYGVAIDERNITKRAVFLIDKQGVVRFEGIETATKEYSYRPSQLLERVRELMAQPTSR